MNESAQNAKKDGFMGPKLLLTLAMTVTGILSTAHANSNAPQERWEGYRAANSSEVQNLNLPFEDFAENAVLAMESVGMTRTAGERFDVVDVTTVPQETNPTILAHATNKIPFQIETCRKQGLRYCPVLGYTNRGTVFFNRGRFVTCRHGFHNWISLASQLNGHRPVSEISPPIILRNTQGEVLYNSANDGKSQMQFSAINDDPRLNFQTFHDDTNYPSRELGRAVANSDYVEMTLDERITTDFALTERTSGTQNLGLHEETFAVGYPGTTNVFPNGIGDAPGRTLMLSNGRAIAQLQDYSLIQTTNFNTPGMSGGPMLTSTGELAGVNCRVTTDTSNPSAVTTFTYPLGKNLARNHWRSLVYPSESQLASLEVAQPGTVSQ